MPVAIPGNGSLTLPADPLAPRHARATLASVLEGVLDDDAMATAVLLASELVTNAVVHAASEVELFWVTDGGCTTIGVRDADTGPLGGGGHAPRPELPESGRGLLIVDGLAEAWGTEHAAGRKTIWFRVPALPPPPAPPPAAVPAADGEAEGSADAAPPGASSAAPVGPVPVREPPVREPPVREPPVREPPVRETPVRREVRLQGLLLPEPVRQTLPYQHHVAEVLARVADAVGAAGGRVTSVAGETLAAYGDVLAGGLRSYPLALAGRPLGTLELHLADVVPDDEVEAFLRIAADRLAVLAYEQGVVRTADGRAEELGFLSEATEMLTATLSVRTALTLLPQLVVPRLAEWAVVHSPDDGGRLERVAVNHAREDAIDDLCTWIDHDPAPAEALRRAVHTEALTTLVVIGPDGVRRTTLTVLPLTSRTRTLGVLVLGRPVQAGPAALSWMLEFGRRAALAVDNARLHEEQARAATALQAALLPTALPAVRGIDLAARYHSASPGLVVGGDFYDAFQLADGSLVCAVGDACGKGAEAAAVTGMSRDLVRMLLRDGSSLSAALQRLNRSLLEDSGSARFCTLALTRLRVTDDAVDVTVCLAGHPEPVLLRSDGATRTVGVPGDLLGVMTGEIALREVPVRLERGDALVLYTDGVTERRDGERMFGLDGVRRALEQAAGADAVRLAEAVEDAARSFVDTELRDDLAILVLRRVD